jgi:hypothetical protein
MKKNETDWSLSETGNGCEEMLILCRLFGDMITVKLCDLRRRELSGAWDAPCPLCASLNKSSLNVPVIAENKKSARKVKKPETNH